MARPSDPQAMTPRKPGRTRTAPPQVPDDFWTQPRMRTYLLFDATGIVYILVGLVALRVAWALAAGPERWNALIASFASPGYVVFHLLALVSAIFVGVRFFRLFPKAQPAHIADHFMPCGEFPQLADQHAADAGRIGHQFFFDEGDRF